MSGRISLLIDSPLRDLLILLRAVPAEARKHAMMHARDEATPIWFEETRGRGETRLEQRVLVNSARVGVTGRNIFLRSGGVGRLSSGTDVSVLASAAEFGASATKQVTSRTRTGTRYTRKLGRSFRPPRRGGYVFYPAVRDASARITSVIIQSCRRALFDALDGKR
jgi:hypothetical protein